MHNQIDWMAALRVTMICQDIQNPQSKTSRMKQCHQYGKDLVQAITQVIELAESDTHRGRLWGNTLSSRS